MSTTPYSLWEAQRLGYTDSCILVAARWLLSDLFTPLLRFTDSHHFEGHTQSGYTDTCSSHYVATAIYALTDEQSLGYIGSCI